MMQERLYSLALINIHCLAEVNLDVVVALFGKRHPRSMGLGTPLKNSSSTTVPKTVDLYCVDCLSDCVPISLKK